MINTVHNFVKITVLTGLNLNIFFNSEYIDVDQLRKDIDIIFDASKIENITIFLITSIFISSMSLFLIFIFKPFIDVYLLYFFRFTFFVLLNLLSLSSVYILLRIYGYSRLQLFLYLILSSVFLFYYEKFTYKVSR